MRIRSTKPEFWRSERVALLSWDARLVLKGLESYVDDNGVGKDDIALILGDVFSRDMLANSRDTLARVSEAISELSQHGFVHRYEADGTKLLYLSWWDSNQRIDRPGKGRHPRPDGTMEYKDSEIRDSVASPPDTLAPGTGEQGSRGAGEQEAPAKPKTPAATRIPDDFDITPEMRAWADEKVPGLNITWATEGFIDYWRSATKNAVKKDWTATWRGWLRRNYEDGKLGPSASSQSNTPSFWR